MSTLSIKVSSGNLESYEALFLQLADPAGVAPVERLELAFGDVTQVFPSAYGLLAAYLGRTRDRSKRPLVTRRFGANPQSAKLERAMDAIGFIPAVVGDKAAPPRAGSGMVPLQPITRDTLPEQVASRVLEAVLATAQPTRDAKETLFVVITELVENVLRHGQVETPAYLCGQLSTQKKKLELVLVDTGIGVRASMEGGKDEESVRRIRAGESALALAVEAGRTSKGEGNTGFGLFVAANAVRLNRGVFRLTSGDESLLVSREGDKHRTHARWHGTVVNLLYNLDKTGALSEVYRTLPQPLPEAERFLAAAGAGPDGAPQGEEVVFALKGEGPYLGSRAAAAKVRGQIQEAVRQGKVGVADLEGILALAPAYADECFGELLAALGEPAFRKSVAVRGANDSSRILIEAVLERRMKRESRPDGVAPEVGAGEGGEAKAARPSPGSKPAGAPLSSPAGAALAGASGPESAAAASAGEAGPGEGQESAPEDESSAEGDNAAGEPEPTS